MKKNVFSYINRGSVTAFFGVSALTFLAKMVIVFKELVIADRYGRRDEVDAFLIAFLVPSFLSAVLMNAMSTAFIPVYLRYKEKEGRGAAFRLFAGMNLVQVVTAVILALLIRAAALFYLPYMTSAFNGPKAALTYHLLVMLIPYVFCSSVVAYWSAVLNAEEQFSIVVLSPVVSPLAIILCLSLFPGQGIFAVAWGVLLGIAGELFVLGRALRLKGFSLMPRWEGGALPIKAFIRQFLPAVTGGVLMGSTILVDQGMAGMLPAGSVATLSYANKATGFLLSLLATTLATLLTPYFSKRLIGPSPQRLWKSLGQVFLVAFPFCLLLSLGISIFSVPLVKMIFYRGAFTLQDVQRVASVQAWLSWQIPFYLSSVVLVRFVAAQQKNWIVPCVTGCNVVMNIILNFLLMRKMGVEGIALSTSLVHLFSFFLLLGFIYFSKSTVTDGA